MTFARIATVVTVTLLVGLVALALGAQHLAEPLTEALRVFNLALVQHPALRGTVLPLGDGLAYACKLSR